MFKKEDLYLYVCLLSKAPEAYPQELKRSLKMKKIVSLSIIFVCNNRAKLSSYSIIAWISYIYVNYVVKTGKIIH